MDKNISGEKLWQQCNCQLTGFSEYFVDEKPTDSNEPESCVGLQTIERKLSHQRTTTTNVGRQQNEEFIDVDTIY